MVLQLEEALIVDEIHVPGYEKIVRIRHEGVGLDAIISIHSLILGPSLGGTRIYPYPSFGAALNDVLRLSLGMTYKSAIARCGWGGGKSVIIADPKKDKSAELLYAFGLAVDRMRGNYICAEDVGSSPQDMVTIRQATPYVVGLSHEKSSGNPSPYTAWGTFRGIQAALKWQFGSESVKGKTIAIQGMGSVGSRLAEMLFWQGAKLIISDVRLENCRDVAKMTGAKIVSPQDILTTACDVLAPCALGGIIQQEMIPLLQCGIVAGAANNQLQAEGDADRLKERGILYAPDFVINAGGLINVSQELEPAGYDPIAVRAKIEGIYDQLLSIFDIADQKNCSTNAAAMALGDECLKNGTGKRIIDPCFHHDRS